MFTTGSQSITFDKEKNKSCVGLRACIKSKGHLMDARENKRNSAKKHTERSIYSQKAVRAKEALIEKKSLKPKGPNTH
jgi:hypothetical protein